ncbi:Uncharacterized protein Adt_28161 [Abeliophyllum distichum]|uniref:Putative plant transposon protein domain-containing protein n=1 Tax=Abeliophyllum distichum TaxID=126358 RepID=A0ABD1RXT3_9LAMI
MAPKRKDLPIKKEKEKVGSSSSRRQLVETNVDDGGKSFYQISHSPKWLISSILVVGKRVPGKPHLAYPLLVKEFLANFNHAIEKPEADHWYTTWVCGKWIKFSPVVIADYYGLTANDIEHILADLDMTQVTQFLYGRVDAWPLVGPKFLHNQLTESLSIFYIFVCHNIDPTSHRTDFNESRAQFLYHLARGHKIDLGNHIFRFIVDLASQCASGRFSMFSCLISTRCLAEEVPLLPHEEPETPEPPINKRTLGNPMAKRAADNPAPIPAIETDHLLRQIFTQLSEQGRVLSSIQRTQLAMQRTLDHMRIEMNSLKESKTTLRGEQQTINYSYDNVNRRLIHFAWRMDDICTIVSQPSAPSAPYHGSTSDGLSDQPRPSSPPLPPRST